MSGLKNIIASAIIAAAIIGAYALPRPHYQGSSILSELQMPASLDNWQSVDYSDEINKAQDDRYNFLSGAFARVYGTREGRSLLMLILDAGNFHHPRLCFSGSGFTIKDLPDTRLTTSRGEIKVKTLHAHKDISGESFIVMYWMVIDRQKVDWTEQKWKQLWQSLFNKKQVGLMTRLDIPLHQGGGAVDQSAVNAAVAFGQRFISDLTSEMPAKKTEFLLGTQAEF